MKQRRLKSKANNYLGKKVDKLLKSIISNYSLITLDHSISIKIPTRTCMEVKKSTMKLIWNSKGSRIANRPTLFFRESIGWTLHSREESGRDHMCVYILHITKPK